MEYCQQYIYYNMDFPGDSDGKASACNAGDPGLIPGLGRSLENEMATHSSILAWRIPWSEEPGRLQFMGVAKSRTRLSYFTFTFFNSVQFSHSVVSDSLRPHESQHARPPCLSPIPGVHTNSCPLSWWCHPAISSSVVPFSSCPQSLPASEFFSMSQLFAWGGQSIGVSASALVLPMNIQDWFPLGWISWIY